MIVAIVTHHALSYHEYEDDKNAKSWLVGGEQKRSDLISFYHSPLRFGLADSLWISYHTGGLSCKHRNC